MYDDEFASLRLLQNREYEALYLKNNASLFCKQDPRCKFKLFMFASLNYFVGLWSRLGEIGVRTTFIVFAFTAALLFDELNQEIDNIVQKTVDFSDYYKERMSEELETFKNQYDLVCRFVEQINQFFSLTLLIITGIDFATSILDFNNILEHLNLKNSLPKNYVSDNQIYFYVFNGSISKYDTTDDVFFNTITASFFKMKTNPIRTFQFFHPILRWLVILIASNMVESKVGLY